MEQTSRKPEVAETLSFDGGWQAEIKRVFKKKVDQYGDCFYTYRLFTTYTHPQYGVKPDYSVAPWDYAKFDAATQAVRKRIKELESGNVASTVANAARDTLADGPAV